MDPLANGGGPGLHLQVPEIGPPYVAPLARTVFRPVWVGCKNRLFMRPSTPVDHHLECNHPHGISNLGIATCTSHPDGVETNRQKQEPASFLNLLYIQNNV